MGFSQSAYRVDGNTADLGPATTAWQKKNNEDHHYLNTVDFANEIKDKNRKNIRRLLLGSALVGVTIYLFSQIKTVKQQ